MTICEKCEDRSCEKTGKTCKELNKQLRGQGIYSEDYPMKYDSKIIIRESRFLAGKIFEGHLYPERKSIKSSERIKLEKKLQEAIQQLTPRQQDILWRFYWLGQSRKEIAKALNVTPKTAKNTLYDIRNKLKNIL